MAEKRRSDAARRANQVVRSRTVLLMLLFGVFTFVLLFLKLYDLQILRHEELQQEAVAQQTRSAVVTASRGAIYDRNGLPLAQSATAETVNVNPRDIRDFIAEQDEKIKDEKMEAAEKKDKDYIARGLARILELEEDTVRKQLDKVESAYVIVKKRADKAVADEVRRFINGEIDDQGNPVEAKQQRKIHGVYLEPDSKRYYPYSTLAAQVVGFVDADNRGAYGLESRYESDLQGTSGLTVTAKTNTGQDLLYQYEQYYDAANGDELVLTLDTNIQYYLEKGMESMLTRFDAKNGGTGIVMNAKTGAILAMASFPTFDLNDYSAIYDTKLQESLSQTLAEIEAKRSSYATEEEYNAAVAKAKSDARGRQWRNRCITDTYEPGSTFKPITLAAALEEGVVNMNTTFNCTGSVLVQGWGKPIYCSKHSGHGIQDLKTATGNSCNPAFINMGMRLGTETYYDYLEAFGLMESTGIDAYGEAESIFSSRERFCTGVVSLASYAFGQTFNVTPLQLIRAQAATINGGYLYEPYLVEQVLDDRGNVVMQHDASPVRQVISEETSAKVRECLEYVVASGTGKNGQVAGYRIGGKTGTADKTGNKDKEVVVSFMCFAPANDPEIIMLITMDTPSRTTGTYVSGGNMVAPTASQIMGEILPYLGIEPDYSAEGLAAADATVPNVTGKTLEEAAARLQELGFAYRTVGGGAAVTDQTPEGGSIVPGSATVILYMGEQKSTDPCTVPNVEGMTAAEANTALTNAGLILRVAGTTSGSGNVRALSQDVAAGEKVAPGSVITVRFGDSTVLD
ncbi:penicillin-binding transpeptidase domain-containing protein [Dysosmobacter sp.]|uniref:penicillin-binding transpeptidase domain-containing protein n=1 Tax=Dysosmobacter sp. TaxID=2591382 RepID=UPI002A901534|nr:penicillin-binding transpeptidase domain-containing protein [Dysosmobacter sp.]MDY3281064.1 penicillin-binding transpeptidase domain-containing protein [Dysosmobacter sp.]